MRPAGVKIYTNGGLLPDAWLVLMGQLIIVPLLYIFNPPLILLYLKRMLLLLKLKMGKGNSITQVQANRVYEYPNFDPAFAYAGITKVVFMVLFFQPLFPISGFVGVGCFFLLYWSQKYRLLRKASRPIPINLKSAYSTNFLISLGPLIYSIGSIIFDMLLLDEITKPSWAIFGFGLLSIFVHFYKFPYYLYTKLNCEKKCSKKRVAMKIEDAELLEKYEDAQVRFHTDYRRSNPITAEEGMKEYYQMLQERIDSGSQLRNLLNALAMKNFQESAAKAEYYNDNQSAGNNSANSNVATVELPPLELFELDEQDHAFIPEVQPTPVNNPESVKKDRNFSGFKDQTNKDAKVNIVIPIPEHFDEENDNLRASIHNPVKSDTTPLIKPKIEPAIHQTPAQTAELTTVRHPDNNPSENNLKEGDIGFIGPTRPQRNVYNYFNNGIIGGMHPVALAYLDLKNNKVNDGYVKTYLEGYAINQQKADAVKQMRRQRTEVEITNSPPHYQQVADKQLPLLGDYSQRTLQLNDQKSKKLATASVPIVTESHLAGPETNLFDHAQTSLHPEIKEAKGDKDDEIGIPDNEGEPRQVESSPHVYKTASPRENSISEEPNIQKFNRSSLQKMVPSNQRRSNLPSTIVENDANIIPSAHIVPEEFIGEDKHIKLPEDGSHISIHNLSRDLHPHPSSRSAKLPTKILLTD